jgi:cell division protein FtsN
MPKIEPVYEPRGQDAFDGGEDDHEQDDEGSRLPLLIVIGLLVLVAFGGVVWLAYQHGVERGMKNAPHQMVAQDNQTPTQNYDKIYQKPAPSDEDTANDDTAPPPPAMNSDAAPKTVAPPSAPAPKPAKSVAATPVAPPPVPAAEATRPPAKLVSAPASAKTADATPPAPSTPAPSTPAPSTPAPNTPAPSATGGYVLQIGSYKSHDEAEASWKIYKAKHALAASHGDSVKQVDLGAKGTWYRLRIGGFESKDAAEAFCAKLKASGGDCILAKD